MSTYPANIRTWLSEPMSNEAAKSVRRLAAADDVHHIAVMPDVHLASDVCIGTVVATSRLSLPGRRRWRYRLRHGSRSI